MSLNLTNAAQGGNFTLSRAGGATANISGLGAATTYTIQNITYSNQGKLFFKATAAGAAGPVLDGNTGLAFLSLLPNKACAYVWALTQAGVVQLVQGPIVPYTDTVGGGSNVPNSTRCPFPGLADGSTVLAYVVVKAGSTAVGAWLPGTNNWTGVTGITADAAVDLFSPPTLDPFNA